MKTKIVIWDGCILADRFIYRNHRVRKEFDRLLLNMTNLCHSLECSPEFLMLNF